MFLMEIEEGPEYSNIPGKLYRKFHQDPSNRSLSRLYLSSKSLPGVLQERDVLDML